MPFPLSSLLPYALSAVRQQHPTHVAAAGCGSALTVWMGGTSLSISGDLNSFQGVKAMQFSALLFVYCKAPGLFFWHLLVLSVLFFFFALAREMTSVLITAAFPR